VAGFSISANGVLTQRWGQSESVLPRELVHQTRGGTATTISPALQRPRTVRVAPNGTRAVVATGLLDDSELHLVDLRGGVRATIPIVSGGNSPVWIDDRTIAFAGTDDALMEIPVDGSTLEPTPLRGAGSLRGSPATASRDGRMLVSVNRDRDIWLVTLDGSAPPAPWLATPFRERVARFSPDGRWVAFMSDRGGRDQVWVSASGQGAYTKLVSAEEGGTGPEWALDEDALYFVTDTEMWSASFTVADDIEFARPQSLFQHGLGFGGGYSVARDGFIWASPEQQNREPNLHLVLNWFEELKARAAGVR